MPSRFDDQCNAPSNAPIDFSNWDFENGTHGFGANEPQAHVDHLANCHHDGQGHLALIALKEHYEDSPPYPWSVPREYTSPRLNSSFGTQEFRLSVGQSIEMKFKLPQGLKSNGMHPSFWGNSLRTDAGWFYEGEIDLFEIDMTHHNVRMTLISEQNGNEHDNSTVWTPIDWAAFVAAEHVIRFKWAKERMEWILDGIVRKSVTPSEHGGTWPFTENTYALILSLPMGRWAGSPDSSTTFPQTMLIDYVHVEDLVSVPGPVPTPQPPTGGHKMDGSGFSAKDARFSLDGTAVKAYATNGSTPAWVEYLLDFGDGGYSLNVSVDNYGSLPAPVGYKFHLEVRLDGTPYGVIDVAAGTVGALNLGLANGIRTVRLSWTNDAYASGQYDANLRINSINLVPNSITPAPVSGKELAIANLKAMGWTDPAILAVVNP